MPKTDIPVETLIEQLHGEDWTARCDAARLLGQSRDPRAVDSLLPDLNDSDWRVRRNAAQALGALRDKRAVGPLLQALRDRTMTVRQRAIVALGRIKDIQALPALLEILLENRHESYDANKAIHKFGRKALPEIAKAFEKTRTYLKNGRLRSNLSLGADRWISKTNNGQWSNLYCRKWNAARMARDVREWTTVRS
jgi:HEAT repeat protein